MNILKQFTESSLPAGGVLAGTSGGTTKEFPGCKGESQQGAGDLDSTVLKVITCHSCR